MSSKIKLMVLMLVVSLCVAACSRDKKQAKKEAPAETAKGQVRPAPPPPEIFPVSGKVLEVIDTGSFIYVALDWKGERVWATVPGVDLKVGEVISLDHANMIEKDFHSTALNRTFEKLIFASGIEGRPPRSRANNPKDSKNRRSGKLMAIPSPAPPRPTEKVTGKVAAKAGQ